MDQLILQDNNYPDMRNSKLHIESFMDYTKQAKSANSVRAYRFAWKKYQSWCAEHGYDPINFPKGNFELLIGMFLCDMAKRQVLTVASLECYLAGIRHFYLEQGINADTRHIRIREAMAGIKRVLGTKQTQKKALHTDDLSKMLELVQDQSKAINVRDKALMLIGFAGAFRRSELVGMDIEHVEFSTDGITVFLGKSKTDQNREGRFVDIPYGKSPTLCPVTAFKNWIKAGKITEGPVFRPIDKVGRIASQRLSDKSVATIIKKLAAPFGFEEKVAGHSLRAGLVTTAIKKGVDTIVIARQTGHKSINTLKKYERLSREFEQNAAAHVGL
jgi:site-specific recombinase XerD